MPPQEVCKLTDLIIQLMAGISLPFRREMESRTLSEFALHVHYHAPQLRGEAKKWGKRVSHPPAESD